MNSCDVCESMVIWSFESLPGEGRLLHIRVPHFSWYGDGRNVVIGATHANETVAALTFDFFGLQLSVSPSVPSRRKPGTRALSGSRLAEATGPHHQSALSHLDAL